MIRKSGIAAEGSDDGNAPCQYPPTFFFSLSRKALSEYLRTQQYLTNTASSESRKFNLMKRAVDESS
jgi:hypothetical protein